jgi:TonB family protein
MASLLLHCATLTALLVLAGAPPDLPAVLPETSVGMVFVGNETAPPPAGPPIAPPPPASPVQPPLPSPSQPLPAPPPSVPTPPPMPLPEPVPAPEQAPPPPPRPVAKPAPPRHLPVAVPRTAAAGVPPATAAPAAPVPPAAPAAPAEGPPAGPRLLGGMSGQCLADYPDRLKRRAVQGTVMIRVHISADGMPGAASVVANGGGSDELGRLALAAVQACRRFPKATEAYVADVPYRFVLE